MGSKNSFQKAASGSSVVSSSNCQDMDDKIRKVAQELYEKRGATPGHELEDWLKAEKIVRRSCR